MRGWRGAASECRAYTRVRSRGPSASARVCAVCFCGGTLKAILAHRQLTSCQLRAKKEHLDVHGACEEPGANAMGATVAAQLASGLPSWLTRTPSMRRRRGSTTSTSASMHRSHRQWWHHVEAPSTVAVLEVLQSDDAVRRALVAALELSVENSMDEYRRQRHGNEPLEQWLALNLGENLLFTSSIPSSDRRER